MPEKMKELEKACEEMRELEKACESVIEYLNQNHDPHTYVVISQDSIKLQKSSNKHSCGRWRSAEGDGDE